MTLRDFFLGGRGSRGSNGSSTGGNPMDEGGSDEIPSILLQFLRGVGILDGNGSLDLSMMGYDPNVAEVYLPLPTDAVTDAKALLRAADRVVRALADANVPGHRDLIALFWEIGPNALRATDDQKQRLLGLLSALRQVIVAVKLDLTEDQKTALCDKVAALQSALAFDPEMVVTESKFEVTLTGTAADVAKVSALVKAAVAKVVSEQLDDLAVSYGATVRYAEMCGGVTVVNADGREAHFHVGDLKIGPATEPTPAPETPADVN